MSDDVSRFLQQVAQLNDRRIEEDEARTRELEEKILQEKRERQARRAERARSISPQKSSPANTPPPPSHRKLPSHGSSDGLVASTSSPALDKPSSPSHASSSRAAVTASSDAMGYYGISATSPSKENESPYEVKASSPSNTTAGSGGRPLSWQRRPTSSDRPKSRPLSMVAAENAAARSSVPPSDPSPPADEQTFSKDQIAQALGAKDPAWFRQTADRGLGSAAYRKNQVEDDDRLDMSSVRAQLPGMAREGSDLSNPRASTSRTGSPMPLSSSQRFNPPTDDGLDADVPATSPTRSNTLSGRTSPTRPVSPTKGMGGFVQSAMMKRSDSVKRWSVTSPPGLARADSISSNRSTPQPTSSSRPSTSSLIRDGSTTPSSSRPTSRGATGYNPTADADATPKPAVADPAPETKPSLGLSTTKDEDEHVTPPSSPSKTMDPRRWSPTKASWLETALNKPESPKPKPTPPPSNQPAWMVELNKAKAQKASNPSAGASELGSRAGSATHHKHEVSIGGLMRSTPVGASVTKPAATPFGSAYSVAATPATTIGSRPGTSSSFRSSLSKSTTTASDEPSSSYTSEVVKTRSPPAVKPKPDNPPKTDFRTGLKPRQGSTDGGSRSEVNEFQNVFGSLRRTETKNYVAPDTFKDNITRGKAALNITGGPKKTERRDDFKDAILKKKAEFKQAQQEGGGIKRTVNPSQEAEKPVPEGLAKRAEMSRSATVSKRDRDPASDPIRTETARPMPAPKPASAEAVPTSKTATEPPVLGIQKEASSPARLQGRAGGSALANRFNPALAGMLARGPPPMASGGGKSSEDSGSGGAGSATAGSVGEPAAPGPQLTHMTKGRARGPRRKAPTAAATASGDKSSVEPAETSPVPALESSFKSGPSSFPSPTFRPPPIEAPKRNSVPRPVQVEEVEDEEAPASPKPPIHAQVAAQAAAKNRAPSPVRRVNEQPPPPESPSSPKKLDLKRRSAFLDQGVSLPSPKAEPAKRSPSPASPKKFDAYADKVDSEPVVSARNATTMFGGASSSTPSKSPSKAAFDSTPKATSVFEAAPQLDRPDSPPKRTSRALPMTPRATSPTLASPMRSPTKQTMEVSAMLDEFFGPQRPKQNYRADTAEILMSRPQVSSRIQTTSTQLFHFSADGKKVPVPAHNERVLFEREMYLCAHNFVNGAGKKVSEVYFWAGDEVPLSTIEDADVFVNREARSLGGKVVKLRQGKETAEFVQALGGIVITRRGSSNKYDSLAPHMLCGRRHLGQVAFDEVDFAPASLCSGFPYLISLQGKCYLWKGKGSDVDELGCARLVGMDLTLTGELIEVDDGNEPATFWEDVFGGGSKSGSADHWRLKPNYGMYCGRLFCSEAYGGKQISEISPFSQADLRPTSIYIIDAFFEMYIIVGARAQTQYPAFRNALDFAQEYAILASSMEDRPFVPISTVVLEGIPRDLKSVFRKWKDSESPTVMNPAATGAGLKRGRSLRILPLTHALQALSE